MKGTHIVKLFSPLIFLVLLLGIAVPVLADYFGPDRTRTESYVETYDWGVWAKPDPTGNSCNHTYGTDCVVCTWERTPGSPCGDATYWYKVGTRSEVVERTVTYPEATINSALNGCTLRNGWCNTSPLLALTAQEPVSGYQITLIEGARNGERFACNGASCEVPLLEGENVFTFWAISSWGDSSRMGNLVARVDTQSPQIIGEMSGTTGEAGWYVSSATFSASASDPVPGSGVETLFYSLDGSAWTPYAAPVTAGDGTHTIVFRAQDVAGHSSEISQSVQVDTQPPQVDASLTGEQVNGWYLGQVTFTANGNDDGSGLSRIEYALDGNAWQQHNAPLTIGDGIHILYFRAFDVAGNVSEFAPLNFQVDGTPPRIQLTDAWYIWESGEVTARDGQSGLAGVEIEIRDPQGRWQKVASFYETKGDSFTKTIAWDRRFGDGTLAPIGMYDVVVRAFDRAGNMNRETAHIVIPAPNTTPTPLPTRIPLLFTATPVAANLPSFSVSTETPMPTRTPVTVAFGGAIPQSANSLHPSSTTSSANSSTPLWGAAALAAIAGATVYALEQRRRRKEEEARQLAEAQREAARRNAAEEARKVQNWLQGKALLEAQLREAEKAGASQEQITALRKIALTKGIGVSLGMAVTTIADLKKSILGGFARQKWETETPHWIPACTIDNPYGLPPITQPALNWLIDLYQNDLLPGKTALERTRYILYATENASYVHFSRIPEGDSGFSCEYQDSLVWRGSSNQVGHFLTAVDISIQARQSWWKKGLLLDAVIGHEMIGDWAGPGLQIVFGFTANFVTFGSVHRWFLSGKDENFEKIITLSRKINNLIFDETAQQHNFYSGNSIQDLRLSHQGWKFGELLSQNNIENPEDAAEWLKKSLEGTGCLENLIQIP